MGRLGVSFFERDPIADARERIGAIFIWQGCKARIVETEAYAAHGDPSCRTFFRPGARDFVVIHPAGAAYVDLT
jgi:3-methyladenine DNA glycosylase Mpg